MDSTLKLSSEVLSIDWNFALNKVMVGLKVSGFFERVSVD